jgi:hypothetical protein
MNAPKHGAAVPAVPRHAGIAAPVGSRIVCVLLRTAGRSIRAHPTGLASPSRSSRSLAVNCRFGCGHAPLRQS